MHIASREVDENRKRWSNRWSNAPATVPHVYASQRTFPLVRGPISGHTQILANVRERACGAKGNRTLDLVIANDALYQLSYSPEDDPECSAAAGGRRW